MRKDDPIVGWPEWLFTACLYLIAIVSVYLQVSKPPSAESSVDERQAARQCRCLVETP